MADWAGMTGNGCGPARIGRGAADKAGRGGDGCDRIGPDSIVHTVSPATQRNSMTGTSAVRRRAIRSPRGEPPNVVNTTTAPPCQTEPRTDRPAITQAVCRMGHSALRGDQYYADVHDIRVGQAGFEQIARGLKEGI